MISSTHSFELNGAYCAPFNVQHPTSNVQTSNAQLAVSELDVESWMFGVERLPLSFKCQGGDSNP